MQLKNWQPPWPPIYLGDDQWIIMRDSKREPAAIVRALRFGPRNELYYRVVTWAAASADRALVGYFPDLETADRAVLFAPKSVGDKLQPVVLPR